MGMTPFLARFGQGGNDVISTSGDDSSDRSGDSISCGPGIDRAFIDEDDIAVGCELVFIAPSGRRSSMAPWLNAGGRLVPPCAHKDCKRTDASPLELLRFSREGELLEVRTFQFCDDYRMQLYAVKESRTLPPADWFAPGYMPDVRPF
jgi:hypothetical protein